MNCKHLQSVIFLAFIHKLCCSDTLMEQPGFRIIAPQIICKHTENSSLRGVPESAVISFQPRDGIQFSYKFRIFFKSLSNSTFSQRETLLIWKAVRALEHRLNVMERLAISDENMLFINKSEVFPGVKYVFHVTGITDAGEASGEEIFSLTYSDSFTANENVDGINLLLIGSEIAIASLSFTYHAKVSFCKRHINHYIQWRVYHMENEFQNLYNVVGASLNIASNSFVPGSVAIIEAHVIEKDSSKVLAKGAMKVHVIPRGFQAHIIPTSAKIGVNSSLTLRLSIKEFDYNIADVEVFWEYYDSRLEAEIVTANPPNRHYLVISFNKPSRYVVLATAISNGISTKVAASVEVVSGTSVGYDFQYVPFFTPVAKQSYDFTVMVEGLLPQCKADWACVQEDGFVFINPNDLERDNLGGIGISHKEAFFLSEITDTIYEKINKEITLSIPSEKKPRWQGLQGNVQYKFRLNTLCPAIDSYIKNEISSTLSYFEFIIHTNSPPIIERININPSSGVALKTIFQISCTEAKDLLLDAPLSYELCGHFDNYTICFGKFFEYKLWKTALPFTKNPAMLFIKVCDIQHACSKIYKSDVVVKPTTFTNSDLIDVQTQILSAFRRSDYIDGNNILLNAAITFKNTSPQLFKGLRVFVNDMLSREIDRLIERTVCCDPPQDIVKFAAELKLSLELLSLNDTKNLEKLLELLDQHVTSTFGGGSFTSDLEDESQNSIKGTKEATYISTTFASLNLLLIGDIAQSKVTLTPADKASIFKRVSSLVKQMCRNTKIGYQLIETRFSTIEMEKCSGVYMMRKEFQIRQKYSSSGLFKIMLPNETVEVDKNYCIVSVQHPVDYYTAEETLVVGIQVFDITNGSHMVESIFNGSKNELMPHILYLELQKTSPDENTCLFLKDEKWSQHNCVVKGRKASNILCACPKFGYIRVGQMDTPTSTQAAKTTAWHNNSATNNEKRINSGSIQLLTPGYLNEKKSNDVEKGQHAKYLIAAAVAIVLICASGIASLFYYRRLRKFKDTTSIIQDMRTTTILERRQRGLGVKYATLYDLNMLRGIE